MLCRLLIKLFVVRERLFLKVAAWKTEWLLPRFVGLLLVEATSPCFSWQEFGFVQIKSVLKIPDFPFIRKWMCLQPCHEFWMVLRCVWGIRPTVIDNCLESILALLHQHFLDRFPLLFPVERGISIVTTLLSQNSCHQDTIVQLLDRFFVAAGILHTKKDFVKASCCFDLGDCLIGPFFSECEAEGSDAL